MNLHIIKNINAYNMKFPNIIKFINKNKNEEMYMWLKNPNKDIKLLYKCNEIIAPSIIKINYMYLLSNNLYF